MGTQKNDAQRKEEIMMQLETVIDPELGVDVVSLGLIYDVQLKESDVKVTMTLTTPGCPLHDTMINGVKAAVEQHPDVTKCEVELVWEPAWTPDRMKQKVKDIFWS
ncbi:Metal-sulfur cluster biosynthetic enzyme [Evansella caseinilytica]|uniref:Metal-sulfur cluster biosynthetic enzyme n=1 Tax=Evansella caseinilytica TaxID=1503961 RepID=A0A1H3PLB7_9BACI|nr:metal-sulfur cluster assembly factor [Evansella caseinilytica]SDZ01807.1 Metal-sulfur cluster biosynthetic enzyme [Evansella caseinilytica]